MLNNKRGVTLIELILYVGIMISVVLASYSIVAFAIKVNYNSSLNTKLVTDIVNNESFLNKGLANINDVLLLSHKTDNTPDLQNGFFLKDSNTKDSQYYNQHLFTLNELETKCGFIKNDNYDLVAFTSKNQLDPIVVGVIERQTPSGKPYRQLAIYKYRSLKDQDLLKKDRELYISDSSKGIAPFINDQGRYITEGLTDWKCDIRNGFLIPISSKYLIGDNSGKENNQINLMGFKVLTEKKLENIVRYGQGYVELLTIWEAREGEQGRKGNVYFQTFSKEFSNY